VLLLGKFCIQVQVKQGSPKELQVVQAKQGSSQGSESKAGEPQGRRHQALSEAS
jgi:hypothetical protein